MLNFIFLVQSATYINNTVEHRYFFIYIIISNSAEFENVIYVVDTVKITVLKHSRSAWDSYQNVSVQFDYNTIFI